MPALDAEEETLPPLWGKSYWWTRGGALIGFLALIAGVTMVLLLSRHIGACNLPSQLTNPTLAIEIARNWKDVTGMVGPCQAPHCGQSKDTACLVAGDCKIICPDKVKALRYEQYEDYVFIVIYWLLFLYLGIASWNFCYAPRFPLFTQVLGKAAGIAIVVCGTLGAHADWLENDHILAALNQLPVIAGPEPIMRYFAYIKWRYVFLAMGSAAPLFLFWTGRANPTDSRDSAFSHLLAWLTAALALSTAWTGVAACLSGDDHRLEVATERLDLVILATTLTLATAQLWRGGTLTALDRLAAFPILRRFTRLFYSDGESS